MATETARTWQPKTTHFEAAERPSLNLNSVKSVITADRIVVAVNRIAKST